MPNETITDVVEGEDGFIWVSSEAGLVRFAGGNFEPIAAPADAEGVRVNTQYLELHPSSEGQLWIANSDGYQVYDARAQSFQESVEFETDLIDRTFPQILHIDKSNIWVLLRNDSETVLMLTDYDGVMRQQWILRDANDGDHFYTFAGQVDSENLWFWVEGESHTLKFSLSELSSTPSQLSLGSSFNDSSEDRPKIDWLALLESNMSIVKIGDMFTTVDLGAGAIADPSRRIANSKFEEAIVRDVAETPDGRIWVATNSTGLIEISAEFDHFTQHVPADNNPNSLPGYTVTSLLVDRFGMLWLGTYNGVFLVDPERNTTAIFSKANRFLENSDAIELLVQDSHLLWVGHATGVDVIDLETGTKRGYSPNSEVNFAPSEVSALAQTANGTIYLGSQFSENLYVLNEETDKFEVREGFQTNARTGGILALDSLGENGLLVSKPGELLHFQNGEFFVVDGAEPINSSGVVQLNSEEYLIAQANEALFVYNVESRVSKHVILPSLEGRTIYDIDSKNGSVVWAVTEAGAFELEYVGGVFSVLSQVPAARFPSNQYASILVDQQDDVWVASQGGVYRLSSQVDSGGADDSTFSVSFYGDDQGFPQSTYFVGTAARIGKDIVALGSSGGAIVFNPSSFKANSAAPDIYLTGLLRYNMPVAVGGQYEDRVLLNDAFYRTSKLDLYQADAVIGFQFSALHTRTPKTSRLWYQMTGIDPEWIETTGSGLATYSSLPPGDYQFRIRAESGDSVQVEAPYVLNVRMHPAWWQAWEFRLAFAMALLLLAVAFSNWRTRLVRDRAATLEAMIKEATTGLAVKNKQLIVARENAETAMKARSQFLANMSHEIRTPINGVIGMTSLLENSSLTKEQRSYLGTVKSSGESLLGIINEILDFSKIESGEIILEEKPFSIEKCVSDAVNTLLPSAAEKGIQLVVYFQVDRKTILVADGQRLGQALLNLIANAVKFTKKGQVIVDVSWDQSDRENKASTSRVLNLSVIDSGIGISDESLVGLFDPFTQADASTTRKYGGTGLGLSISKKTVENMDGELIVTSLINQGSTFSIVLPVDVEPQSIEQDRLLEKTNIAALVSDQFEKQALVHILEREGANVAAFEQAEELVAHIDRFEVATLFVYGACIEKDKVRVFSYLEDSKKSIPMVYVSCLESYEQASKRYSNVLRKPILPSELLSVIDRSETKQSATQDSENMLGEESQFGDLRVLIAEDNKINQIVAKKIISTLGVEADIAENGVDALELVTENHYDIVFMDIQMPEMDGIEAAKHIRTTKSKTPYIIAMTANVYAEDRERCMAAGMNDFVAKPVRIEVVREAMLKAQSMMVS
ncbi:MAG: response regulator [Pseudohongiellaceae bacterium]